MKTSGGLSRGAEKATAPPIISLKGYCPLKNNQSRDAVLQFEMEECVICS